MFLTPEELRTLTGSVLASVQVRWLRRHGWRYEVDDVGRPVVLRSVEQRLSAWGSKEAATFLGCRPKTVCAFAAAGLIPGVKLGRDWKFDETTLREWLEQQTRANVRTAAPAPAGYVRVPRVAPRIGERAYNSLGEQLDAMLKEPMPGMGNDE